MPPDLPAPDLVLVVLGKFFSFFAKRILELAEDKAENKNRIDSHRNHQTTKFSSSKLRLIANLRAPKNGRRYSPNGGSIELIRWRKLA